MTRTDLHLYAAMVAVLVLGILGGVLARHLESPPPTQEETERACRAWADRLGIRVTGVACEGPDCTVAPEQGAPFRVRCNPTCRLAD